MLKQIGSALKNHPVRTREILVNLIKTNLVVTRYLTVSDGVSKLYRERDAYRSFRV